MLFSLFRSLRRALSPRQNRSNSSDNVEQFHCNVLFVNGCDLPTLRRYRVEHQREQLEVIGVSTAEVHYCDIKPDHADAADVFVIYRCPLTTEIASFIERVHKLNKKIYFDVDDLVVDTCYTNSLPVVQAMSDEEKSLFDDGVERNGKTLKLCDGAIVTTERLAAELSKYVSEVFINRNVASQAMVLNSERALTVKKVRGDRVVLGYFSGSMTHNADFEQILPALGQALRIRPNAYMKIVGDLELPNELLDYSDRIIRSEKVSWEDLPSLIASVDINLAPLEPNLFNEAKSENKWTEAALVKVPTIASNCGAFAKVIAEGITGLLCSTTEEWLHAILKLIDDTSLRQTIGEAAYCSCLLHHTSISTGFPLAHFLCGGTADIEHMTPATQTNQALWVRQYLKTRGFDTTESINPACNNPASLSLSNRLEMIRREKRGGKHVAAFVYERFCGDDATFRYFGLNPIERLRDSSHWVATYLYIDELAEAQDSLDCFDEFILIRCRIRPELLALARYTKTRAVPIAYLIDDNAIGAETSQRIIDIMASDPANDFEQAFWRGTTIRFDLASMLSDSLVVPNDFFARILRSKTGKPVHIIHSSLNDEQVGIAERVIGEAHDVLNKHFIIGYFSGTSSHQEDFALVEQTIATFLDQHDDATLLICGAFQLSPALYRAYLRNQLILMPRVDYVTLQYIQASVDVVLAPLCINDFSNCKSALKVFEAAIVGTPACASPSFSYIEAIEFGITGYICSTPLEWNQALETLYSDPKKRQLMGYKAHEYAVKYYYGQRVLTEVEETLNEILSSRILPIPEEVCRSIEDIQVDNWDDPFSTNPKFA